MTQGKTWSGGGTRALVPRNEGWPLSRQSQRSKGGGKSQKQRWDTKVLLKGTLEEKGSLWTWQHLASLTPTLPRSTSHRRVHFCWGQHKGSLFCPFQNQIEWNQNLCSLHSWHVLTSLRKSHFCQEKANSFWLGPKGLFKLLKQESHLRFLTHSANRSISLPETQKRPGIFSKWTRSSKWNVIALLRERAAEVSCAKPSLVWALQGRKRDEGGKMVG